jgi:hypothetical protein
VVLTSLVEVFLFLPTEVCLLCVSPRWQSRAGSSYNMVSTIFIHGTQFARGSVSFCMSESLSCTTSSVLTSFARFASIWTFVTAGLFSLLFLHPTWSRHSISSIGTQGIWLLVTWLFWVVGAGVINGSLPSLINNGICKGIMHCVQLRLLFGVAVVERYASATLLVFLSSNAGCLACCSQPV